MAFKGAPQAVLGRWLLVVGTVLAAGWVIQWLVHRLRASEEGLRRLTIDLEHRVAARTAELEASNKDLEAFSYSVSHDLRAPLRAMSGFSRTLLSDYRSGIPAEALAYVEKVARNADEMHKLIEALLDFSRTGRQQLKLERLAPAEIVRKALEPLQAEIERRGVVVDVHSMPECVADPVLLRQVYANLLDNALKFTQRREHAAVEVGALSEGGGAVYYVRDNGAGFDMRYADRLFGVFQRLHSAVEYEGTGAGLAIVQRIIHRHGGRIWAEAEKDRGATFYFTLEPTTG
jgi:light-regulated signal transduction histidine kinase (bacteriophytochrome)